jgi:hypothetical protein
MTALDKANAQLRATLANQSASPDEIKKTLGLSVKPGQRCSKTGPRASAAFQKTRSSPETHGARV